MVLKQLTASVTAQEATLAALSVTTHSDGGGGGKNTKMKKARPGLHVCAYCKPGRTFFILVFFFDVAATTVFLDQ